MKQHEDTLPQVDLIAQVNAICEEFAGAGMASIGAEAAMKAMAPHWQEHHDEGHGPEIIKADLGDMTYRLADMQTTLVHRVNSQAMANANFLAQLTPEDQDQLVASLRSEEPATDQEIVDFWVKDCAIPAAVAAKAIEYRSEFQKNPDFQFPTAQPVVTANTVLLRYELVKSNRRLTFDIFYQDPELTHKGTEDDEHVRFVASNGYEVHARMRQNIESDRLWLRGPSDKWHQRSESIVFSTNEKRDKAYDRYVQALDEWAASHDGLAVQLFSN